MFLKKITALFSLLLLTVPGQAQVSAGISFNNGDLSSFYLALGQTYNVPEREVIIIREREIPDDEIPVVFFIANRAHVRRDDVCDLRRSGKSWMDIVLFYDLDPSIFYIELTGDPGPEYGRVYGHWKHPRNNWRSIRFEDDDIVKMVNLRFVSNHYHVKPEEVVRLRSEHGSFVKVVRTVESPEYRSSQGGHDNSGNDRKDDNKGGKGKGKGKKGKGH